MITVHTLSIHMHYIFTKWKEFSGNWLVSIINKFVLLCILVSLGITLWRWQLLPPAVPLWYTKPWGTDQLAHPYWLFLLPIGSILIYVINVIASAYITADYLVFTQLLFLTSFLVSFLSLITLVQILFLVT